MAEQNVISDGTKHFYVTPRRLTPPKSSDRCLRCQLPFDDPIHDPEETRPESDRPTHKVEGASDKGAA